MKKLTVALMALLMCFSLSTCIRVVPPEPDWLSLLAEAAAAGEREAGLAAAAGWNAGEDRVPLDYDELVLLSKLITWEAGSPWLNDVVRMSVGEVALNRVASSEFPDTLAEVLSQEGEYPELDTDAFRQELTPSLPCVRAALRLLLGERVLQPQVVYQSHKICGKVHATYADLRLGFTYFCESQHPELYENAESGMQTSEWEQTSAVTPQGP